MTQNKTHQHQSVEKIKQVFKHMFNHLRKQKKLKKSRRSAAGSAYGSGHCVYKTEHFFFKIIKKALKQAGFRAFQFFQKNAKIPL